MGVIDRASIKPTTERMLAFVVRVQGRDVHAEVTAEAVLDIPSEKIGQAEMRLAADRLVADRTIAWKVEQKFRAADCGAGTPDDPIHISSMDFPREDA